MKFDLSKMQKKGSVTMSNTTDVLIGLLVGGLLITSLAPTIFNNTLQGSGAPTWLVTLFPIMLGIAILFILIKFAKK